MLMLQRFSRFRQRRASPSIRFRIRLSFAIDSLDQKGDSLTHSDAHCGETEPCLATVKGVDKRDEYSRSAASQGVTEGDRSPVNVDLCRIEAQFLDAADGLSGKSLVQFDEIDVIEAHS